jgi:hypothetical protein
MRKQLIRLQLTTPCTASIRRQKFSKVTALCLILYTSWARTLTFQNLPDLGPADERIGGSCRRRK